MDDGPLKMCADSATVAGSGIMTIQSEGIHIQTWLIVPNAIGFNNNRDLHQI